MHFVRIRHFFWPFSVRNNTGFLWNIINFIIPIVIQKAIRSHVIGARWSIIRVLISRLRAGTSGTSGTYKSKLGYVVPGSVIDNDIFAMKDSCAASKAMCMAMPHLRAFVEEKEYFLTFALLAFLQDPITKVEVGCGWQWCRQLKRPCLWGSTRRSPLAFKDLRLDLCQGGCRGWYAIQESKPFWLQAVWQDGWPENLETSSKIWCEPSWIRSDLDLDYLLFTRKLPLIPLK